MASGIEGISAVDLVIDGYPKPSSMDEEDNRIVLLSYRVANQQL